MRFLKIYQTYIITQKPGLTTFFHLGDEISGILIRQNYLAYYLLSGTSLLSFLILFLTLTITTYSEIIMKIIL